MSIVSFLFLHVYFGFFCVQIVAHVLKTFTQKSDFFETFKHTEENILSKVDQRCIGPLVNILDSFRTQICSFIDLGLA